MVIYQDFETNKPTKHNTITHAPYAKLNISIKIIKLLMNTIYLLKNHNLHPHGECTNENLCMEKGVIQPYKYFCPQQSLPTPCIDRCKLSLKKTTQRKKENKKSTPKRYIQAS